MRERYCRNCRKIFDARHSQDWYCPICGVELIHCHYCGRALIRSDAVEAYDRNRGRRLFFCSEECKEVARDRPDHYLKFSHARRHVIVAHGNGAYQK